MSKSWRCVRSAASPCDVGGGGPGVFKVCTEGWEMCNVTNTQLCLAHSHAHTV